MREVKQLVQRWPLGASGEATPRTRELVFLGAVVALGFAGALLHLPLWQRVALLVAAGGGLRRFLLVLHARARRRPRGEIAVDARGIVRRDRRIVTRIADLDAPFGVTVLTDHLHTSALLAFTAPEQTRFVTVRLSPFDDPISTRTVLRRATTIPESDAAGQGEDSAMAGPHAAELVRLVERRAASAFGRMYLSGSRGEAVVLDGAQLTVGTRSFDLRAPLEWRGFMFHESVGPVATIYQATWVRQGTSEVVLVAPMPPEVTTLLAGRRDLVAGDGAGTQRAFVRDLKLMQSLPDSPPARELRVAIERLFMLPLRHALDRAPKAPRAGLPPARAINPTA